MTAGKILNVLRREGAFFVKAVNQRLRRSQKHLPRYSALGARATLALGGGGARGIAHLGAMEILRGLGVRIEHIAGVSIGSLAGALCALNEDVSDLQRRVTTLVTSDDFRRQQSKIFVSAPATDEPVTSGMFAWWDQLSRFLGVRRRMLELLSRPSLLPADFIQNIITALLPDIDIRGCPDSTYDRRPGPAERTAVETHSWSTAVGRTRLYGHPWNLSTR